LQEDKVAMYLNSREPTTANKEGWQWNIHTQKEFAWQ
jgi:hypothetical protein